MLLNIHTAHRLWVSSTLKIRSLSIGTLFLIWGCSAKEERRFCNDNQAAEHHGILAAVYADSCTSRRKKKAEK